MPSEERGHEVRGHEEVEGSGERNACDTVQHGEDPGNLRLVDCEVGCDRPEFTLGDENFVGV